MSDKMADRRIAPRYPVILRTELTGGGKISARTSDLSRIDCYVDTLDRSGRAR